MPNTASRPARAHAHEIPKPRSTKAQAQSIRQRLDAIAKVIITELAPDPSMKYLDRIESRKLKACFEDFLRLSKVLKQFNA